MPTAHEITWAAYQSAWREIDDRERRDLLGSSVEADVHYVDPTGQASGVDELVSYIAAFNRSTPGATFQNHGFLEHHGQGIADWSLRGPGGETLIEGGSHAVFGDSGKLAIVWGFFPA